MDILFAAVPEKEVRTDALIIPLFEDFFPDLYMELDNSVGGLIRKTLNSGEFKGRHMQATLLHVLAIKAERILLIGLGKQSEISPERLRQAGGKTLSLLRDVGLRHIALSAGPLNSLSLDYHVSQKPLFYFIEGGLLGLYRFERFKSKEDIQELVSLTILDDGESFPLNWLQVTTSATLFARDLVNTPANEKTPTRLSVIAGSLSGDNMEVRVLDETDLEKEAMGSFLSVSRGSEEPPKFILIHYKGAEGAPLVLIGKAITFDSGGISIKPAEGMEKMKYDMAGGASVIATLKAVAELGMALHIIGIVPATENLPSGSASKPGDVVTSVTGKTIEIISTDAEGRLVLADAIGYALKYYDVTAIIDIATLTGACSVAFGSEVIAMMGNNKDLMGKLKKASTETYERVWEMPLFDEYKEYLGSDVADIKNTGGKRGSLMSSGYFLKEFVGDTPWVHLDIAGTAWLEKAKPYIPKGATGVGVRLILNFLKEL
ncbi:MAG: leucyl aminopeptidase [Dissulfurispiraceae bacterium]